MAMIYSTIISDLVDKNNHQIATNFASVLFNTQVKALRHNANISTLRNFMLASLMQHKKYLKGVTIEANGHRRCHQDNSRVD